MNILMPHTSFFLLLVFNTSSILSLEVPMKNGAKMTAIDIQRWYHEAAQRYIAQYPDCHPTYPVVVAEWGSVLDRLASDPMQLFREIDWVMKLHLLTNYMERRGSGWDDPRIAMMDLQSSTAPRSGYGLASANAGVGAAGINVSNEIADRIAVMRFMIILLALPRAMTPLRARLLPCGIDRSHGGKLIYS